MKQALIAMGLVLAAGAAKAESSLLLTGEDNRVYWGVCPTGMSQRPECADLFMHLVEARREGFGRIVRIDGSPPSHPEVGTVTITVDMRYNAQPTRRVVYTGTLNSTEIP